MQNKKYSTVLSVLGGLSLILLYQNCGQMAAQTQFTSSISKANSSPVGIIGVDGAPVVSNTAPSGQIMSTSSSGGSSSSSSSSGSSSSSSGSTSTSSSASSSDLVECELNASAKITLEHFFEAETRNDADDRVCMSSHACLNLLNDYALARNCSLDLGAPSTAHSANAACTAVFPGSVGTCQHAKTLSDSAVVALLAAMSSASPDRDAK